MMLPPAPGDGIFGIPVAVGDSPVLDNLAGPVPSLPIEHQTTAPVIPGSVAYEGGGIFPAETTGPAEDGSSSLDQEDRPGLDFGPNMVMSSSPIVEATAGPASQDEEKSGGTLGFTLIAVVGGAVVGGYYGGGWGILAGSLFGGSAVSGYKAVTNVSQGQESTDREAITSGTYAVGAAAIGTVIWLKLVRSSNRVTPNKPKRTFANPECDIRPVGP